MQFGKEALSEKDVIQLGLLLQMMQNEQSLTDKGMPPRGHTSRQILHSLHFS